MEKMNQSKCFLIVPGLKRRGNWKILQPNKILLIPQLPCGFSPWKMRNWKQCFYLNDLFLLTWKMRNEINVSNNMRCFFLTWKMNQSKCFLNSSRAKAPGQLKAIEKSFIIIKSCWFLNCHVGFSPWKMRNNYNPFQFFIEEYIAQIN